MTEILLTSAIHPEQHDVLARQCRVVVAPDPSPSTIASLIGSADGLIVRNQLAPDVFDHAPRLRGVVRHGVGLDMIPVASATARGIPVANLPGSNTTAVAEYCIAAMLHLRRRLARIDSTIRSEGWATSRALADDGVELAGGTCGIVGVGAIGGRVAAIAAAFGMRVIGLTRRPANLPPHVAAVSRAELFAQADAIVLTCPLNDETRGLVDRAALASMKRGAIIVNASRGPVVDTAAVVDALRTGRLGGAAMDVHDRQPLAGDEPQFDCPGLLLTPHIAGVTATSLHAMSAGSVRTILALLAGERPPNVVNPEVFGTSAA